MCWSWAQGRVSRQKWEASLTFHWIHTTVSCIAHARQVEISHCYNIGSFGGILTAKHSYRLSPKGGRFRGWRVVFNLMAFGIFLTDFQPMRKCSNVISGNLNWKTSSMVTTPSYLRICFHQKNTHETNQTKQKNKENNPPKPIKAFCRCFLILLGEDLQLTVPSQICCWSP